MASTIRGDDNFDSQLKTVNGNSLVGSGDIEAGASTTYNAVATYAMARTAASGTYSRVPARTRAGSGLHPCDTSRSYSSSNTLSGTWRSMSYGLYDDRAMLYVRIS